MASYATLAELKVYLRITDAVDDVAAQLALDAATEAIDLACLGMPGEGRSVTGVALTDVLTDTGHGMTNGTPLKFTLLAGGTGLVVGTQYYVLAATTNTFQLATISVGGTAVNFTTDLTTGSVYAVNVPQFSPVAASIKLACQLQASRWFKRQDSPFGVLGSDEFGNVTRLLAKLDPDVEILLNGHGERTRWGTV